MAPPQKTGRDDTHEHTLQARADRRPRARQPHWGLADVLVQRRRRRGSAVASHSYRQSHDVRRRLGDHGGNGHRGDRPGHAWLPRPLYGSTRGSARWACSRSKEALCSETRHPAHAQRPKSLNPHDPRALARRATAVRVRKDVQSAANTASVSLSRRSTLASENTSGGRIFNVFAAAPVAEISTRRAHQGINGLSRARSSPRWATAPGR